MILIAHRSGPSKYPEQTIASARYAMEHGADMVEVDVRLTKDSCLAVTHDENLKRVFGLDQEISQLDAAEFRSLHHADAPEYSSHMLSEYLDTGFPLLIHVKKTDVLPALVEAVAPVAERIVLGLPTPEAVAYVRTHCPEIRILSFSSKENVSAMLAVGVDYMRLWESWLVPEMIAEVRNSHTPLWVMSGNAKNDTVGEPTTEGLEQILNISPDGLLINDVRRV